MLDKLLALVGDAYPAAVEKTRQGMGMQPGPMPGGEAIANVIQQLMGGGGQPQRGPQMAALGPEQAGNAGTVSDLIGQVLGGAGGGNPQDVEMEEMPHREAGEVVPDDEGIDEFRMRKHDETGEFDDEDSEPVEWEGTLETGPTKKDIEELLYNMDVPGYSIVTEQFEKRFGKDALDRVLKENPMPDEEDSEPTDEDLLEQVTRGMADQPSGVNKGRR
jgi:hypothetical protein